MPGNGAVRPSVRTSTSYGGTSQTQTPTSPADRNVSFDSPHSRTSGRNKSVDNMDGTQSANPRNSRLLDTNVATSRDQSSPRDRSDYHERTSRDRSRPNGRPQNKSPGSTQRICKKCGDPLTGQFVRALGATFHLECFKCQVRKSPCSPASNSDLVWIGLWSDRRIEVLSRRLGRQNRTISAMRNGLLSTTGPPLSCLRRRPAWLLHHSFGAQIPY